MGYMSYRVEQLQERIKNKQRRIEELESLLLSISDRIHKYKSSDTRPNQCIDFIHLDIVTSKLND